MKRYEFLEHTADIKFRAYGSTKEKAFENVAAAISEILSRGDEVEDKVSKRVELKGKEDESLLYDFIDELIYLLDAEQFLVSKAKVRIKEGRLDATILGDDALRYPGLDHIKAATYSEMHIKKSGKQWEIQVVVDV